MMTSLHTVGGESYCYSK